MELGNASAAWLGLLALPIILLYLLRVRPRRRPVSTILFWDEVFEQRKPRALWRTMRHPLSLIAQLLLLGLLLAALIDPGWPGRHRPPERVVLVVDRSASMRATDGATSRLEKARREAYGLVRGLRPDDEMAIIAAGGSVRVLCGLSGHEGTLREALDELGPTDGPARMTEAVQLARRLLDRHPRGRIIVLTDGCLPEAELSLLNDAAEAADAVDVPCETQWRLVGGSADNVGITQLQARRGLVDPLGFEVRVEVRNFGRGAARLRLELERDDELIDVHRLRLSPEEKWTRDLEYFSADGGVVRARLCREPDGTRGSERGRDTAQVGPEANAWRDALSADDQALAVLPSLRPQSVLLVTPGNLFLQRVFEAMPLVDLRITDRLPPQVPEATVVVYHALTPLTMPAGNVLVIDPEQSSDLWELGPVLEQPPVVRRQSQSPLLRHVALDGGNVRWPPVRRLRFELPGETLVGSLGGDPLYVAARRPSGKLLVMNFNLAQGDLPFRTAFPILIGNALSWFRGQSVPWRAAVTAGAEVDLDLSGISRDLEATSEGVAAPQQEALTSIVLRSPRGRVIGLPTGGDRLMPGPLDECGLWTVERQSAAARSTPAEPRQPAEVAGTDGVLLTLACNLANERESDLRPARLPAAEDGESSDRSHRPWWFTLTAVAGVLLVTEWFLYQRRWLD